MPDYIPRSDAEYEIWLENFVSYAVRNPANLGLTANEVAQLQKAQTGWCWAFNKNIAAQATARGTRAEKDQHRTGSEQLVRAAVRKIQASPGADVGQCSALGISVAENDATPEPVPTTVPICLIRSGNGFRHTLEFRDSETSSGRTRPCGTMGAEIHMKVTDTGQPVPLDPSEFEFLSLDTATPHLIEFEGVSGNKTAHYILRWLNSRGMKGPWSEVFSATIIGNTVQ